MLDSRDREPGELLDIYKIAVEEYRFQVLLNWSRTQYLFVLTAGILAVGTGLLNLETGEQSWLVGLVFLFGAFTAGHAIAVTKKQHGYYVNARDRMRAVGRSIGLRDEHLLTTTRGMADDAADRGWWATLSRVTSMHYLLFGMLAATHLGAALYAFLG